jgi:hypothetical protein
VPGTGRHQWRIGLRLVWSEGRSGDTLYFGSKTFHGVRSSLVSLRLLNLRSGHEHIFACDAVCHRRAYGTVTYRVTSCRRNGAGSPLWTLGACCSSTTFSRAKGQRFRLYRVQTGLYLNSLHPTEQKYRRPARRRYDRVGARVHNVRRFLSRGNPSSRIKVTFCSY